MEQLPDSGVNVVVHKIRKGGALLEPTPTSAPISTHLFKPVETKTLTIRLIDHNAPDYIFQGEWTGRDIMVIARTIARAYKHKQLTTRRALSEPKPVSVLQGAING